MQQGPDADIIIGSIKSALTPDLLSREWVVRVKPGEHAVAGHCAVAAEAFYHLSGGAGAGMMPVVCVYSEAPDLSLHFNMATAPENCMRATHWWVRGPGNKGRGTGLIYDPTVEQYNGKPFPYEKGHGCGFMNPKKGQPSRRAAIVIERVQNNLGCAVTDSFRDNQIRIYSDMKAVQSLSL
jgi:hypothetical protein